MCPAAAVGVLTRPVSAKTTFSQWLVRTRPSATTALTRRKGNKEVIHLTTDDDKNALNPEHVSSCCGRCSDKACVRKDNFFTVAGEDKAKCNNSLDKKKSPLPRRQIVKNALSRLHEVGYNVLVKNCQHFATWCRYGEASSDQVDFWSWMAAGSLLAVAGGVAAAVVGSRKSKKQTQ